MLSAASVPVMRSSPVAVVKSAVARGKVTTAVGTSRLSRFSTASRTALVRGARGEEYGLRQARRIHLAMRDMGDS